MDRVSVQLEPRLSQGLDRLGLPVGEKRRHQLLKYLELLEKWGRSYNLTAILDRPSMVNHHLLDSLSAAPYIHGPRLLDVGSGAGLPGIPLAVVRPDLSVTLIESRKKRAQFLIHATSRLELGNTEVVCGRVERYQPPGKFDTLVTRAFASVADFIAAAGRHCADDGRMVALKGKLPTAELAGVESTEFAAEVHRVTVPGLLAQRHIVVLSHQFTGK